MRHSIGEVFVRLACLAIDGETAETLLNRHATDADRGEAAKHVRTLRRRQTLVGRAALRQLLMATTGIDGAQWRLAREANGRPVALHPDGLAGPAISLTHSGGWAACAVASDGAIGIDLEVATGRRMAADIATLLSDNERMAVTREGETALLDFWTLREAIAKARGGTMFDALMLDGTETMAARGRITAPVIGGLTYVTGQTTRAGRHLAVAWRPPHGTIEDAPNLLAAELKTLSETGPRTP